MKRILLSAFCFLFLTSVHCQVSFTTMNTPVAINLLGISFSGSLTGYACGDAGTILKTTDGGITWTAVNSGTSEDLWDIEVMPGSQGQKVIAAGENNTVLKSKDGGATWLAQTIPFQAGSFVFGIQCLDTLNYFACGGDYGTFSGSVLKTTNGGTSWTKTPIATSIFLDKIFMRNASLGFCAGTNTSFSDGSLQKTTNSTSWSVAKSSTDLLTNVWAGSNTHVVSVGLLGQIWHSNDGGTNWSSASYNSTDLFGVQFIDTLHGFACGGDNTTSMILETTDGGLNWSRTTHTLVGAFQSISIGGNYIFMAGSQGTIIKGTLPAPPSTVGLDTHSDEAEALTLYPVPTNDKLWLDLHVPCQGSELTLEDSQGRIVKRIALRTSPTEIDVSDLPGGVYLYKASLTGSEVQGKCLIGR